MHGLLLVEAARRRPRVQPARGLRGVRRSHRIRAARPPTGPRPRRDLSCHRVCAADEHGSCVTVPTAAGGCSAAVALGAAALGTATLAVDRRAVRRCDATAWPRSCPPTAVARRSTADAPRRSTRADSASSTGTVRARSAGAAPSTDQAGVLRVQRDAGRHGDGRGDARRRRSSSSHSTSSAQVGRAAIHGRARCGTADCPRRADSDVPSAPGATSMDFGDRADMGERRSALGDVSGLDLGSPR